MKKQYKKLRKYLSVKQKGNLSRVSHFVLNKPFVKRDNIDPKKKFPNYERGGLIISADFEMAWAWRYTKTNADFLQKGRIERENMPKILKILEDYDIPITFATVGHLFLENCKRGAHDWMRRIPHFDDHWSFTHGDWYDHDPYSCYKEAPEWYAPDLIRSILDSKTVHEIGTHTFSHIDFSYSNCPQEVADDEVKACKITAETYGVTLESIVFPGGTWGNIETLKKHGFNIYRKKNNFDLAYPYRDMHGLLVTTSSGSLEYNLHYGWTPDYYLNRLKKYVDKAIKLNSLVHLWFHPSIEPYILDRLFPPFFDYIRKLRNKGVLWIGTMKSIAGHIDKNNIL
jgi:peptidoglycan/xylan/chitin deacetylase (PgdA/CDA1 family)